MNRDAMLAFYATLPAGTAFVRPEDVLALVQARGIRPDVRMLDIGCGQGQVALALARTFPLSEVIGIDLSPHQIEHARQNSDVANVQFLVADWMNFVLPDDGIDVIIATQVLQFMHDERAFAEYLGHGLASDGLLVLRTVLIPEDEPGRSFVSEVMRQIIQGSIRFYAERDVTELLREVGLSRFRIDKEEIWLDSLPTFHAAILQHELDRVGLTIDDVQPWFWSGTISAIRR